jgi:hypothetical protein
MSFGQMTFLVLDGTFAVCRLDADAAIPAWAKTSSVLRLPVHRRNFP